MMHKNAQKTGNGIHSNPIYVDSITIGFATTTAMWTAGYILHLPGVCLPPSVTFFALAVCYVLCGFFAQLYSRRGISGAAISGLVASILNLLILGSVVGEESATALKPAAMLWIPGSLIAGTLAAVIGAFLAKSVSRKTTTSVSKKDGSISVFAILLAVATLILIAVGGVVTSAGAGLAVVDWPNSYGYNMFLYPLSKMTGGIYYEHAHRLIGTLVGLITIALTIRIQTSDKPKSFKLMGWIALLAVIAQGIMGGLRVTGKFTTSADPADVAPNIVLAVVHGVFGQLFLAFVVVIAALASAEYALKHVYFDIRTCSKGLITTRDLSFAALILVVMQLVIGAVLRHISHGLELHVTMAIIVGVVVIIAGMRSSVTHGHYLPLHRIGLSLSIIIGVQILLGIGAMIAAAGEMNVVVTTPGHPGQTLENWRIIVPTLHQATGAIVLALTAALNVFIGKLVRLST